MRFCVLGVGAIGGVLGARLALSGAEVTLVVRNPARRAAIEAHGLCLVEANGERRGSAKLRVVGTPADAGAQDAVLLTVKAHQIRALVPAVRALFGAETCVVTFQNGIPWWYFQRFDGPHAGYRIAALDPDGAIGSAIAAERIIGCTTYVAGEVLAQGVVRHGGGVRLPLGELDGRRSERVVALSAALVRAGFDAP